MTSTANSKSTSRTWIDRVTVGAFVFAAPLVIAVHAASVDNTQIGHDAFGTTAHHGNAAHFHHFAEHRSL